MRSWSRTFRQAVAAALAIASVTWLPGGAEPPDDPVRHTHVRPTPQGVDPIIAELLELHPSWVTRLQSSHDPSGGNGDNAFEKMPGDRYQTIFHAKGEGRITRLWMTADSEKDVPRDYLELWIEVDGQTKFRGKPLDYFYGKGSYQAPLVLDAKASSGGYSSWVPYPFQREARIRVRGNAQFYQVGYRRGPGSSSGPSAAEIARFLGDEWWSRISPPTQSGKITGDAPFVVAEGPALLTDFAIRCAPRDLPRLRVRVGDQVSFPASFLFGFGTSETATPGADDVDDVGWPTVRSALQYSDPAAKLLVTRLPIPLASGERLQLETQTTATIAAEASAHASPDHVEPLARLRTDYREQPGPRAPTTFPVFDEALPVQLASFVEEIDGGHKGERTFLEGDEMIRFDGMRYPLELGTGTEDYFNGGWYFQNVHTNPLSGLSRMKVINPENGWSNATFEYSMYRNHVLDPLVGRSGMQIGWESGIDGSYPDARFRTLTLAYVFPRPSELSRTRYVLGAPKSQGERSFGEPEASITSAIDAEKNQAPFTYKVRGGARATRLDVPCAPESVPSGLLLLRDYDAWWAGQSASISLNGNRIESFFEPFHNPLRRFAQDAIWLNVRPEDCKAGTMHLDIEKDALAPWTESAYEAVLYK